MTRTRNMADLLDSSGDVKAAAFPATIDGRDLSVDGTKLDGIEASATADQSDAEIKTAYENNSDTNAFTDALQTKLNGIETAATADQTDAEIKTAYENNSDTNAFTDALLSKLNAIEASATADQTDAEIKTAYENNSDTNAFTDALQTKLNGIATSATAVGGSNGVDFDDSVKARFGTGNDLEIYHDGSHSYIDDTGTGSLLVRSNELRVNKYTGEYMLRAFADSSVELYHDNSKKFETTSGGVAVTGDLTATNVFASNVSGLDGTDYINFVNNTQLDFYINGNNEFRFEADGDFHADGNVIAYSTTVSDPRLKENIQPVTDALAKVEQLNGYTFTYKADGVTSAGVMSPEVREVLPSAIKQSKLPLKTGEDNETLYDIVQYDQLHALLIEAVKELSARVQELENGATN